MIAGAIMLLLIILGTFWGIVALAQIVIGAVDFLAGSVTSWMVVAAGLWNGFMGAINIAMVYQVHNRRKSVVRNLAALAVLGTVFGVVQIVFFDAWLQIIAIMLYIGLGVLAQMGKDLFTQ